MRVAVEIVRIVVYLGRGVFFFEMAGEGNAGVVRYSTFLLNLLTYYILRVRRGRVNQMVHRNRSTTMRWGFIGTMSAVASRRTRNTSQREHAAEKVSKHAGNGGRVSNSASTA